MRDRVGSQADVFPTFNVEDLIPANHPLRPIKGWADAILKHMSGDISKAYGETGLPSIPPERLITALMLRALYSIRSEIQLCEQINYNLLFRWFLDMQPSERLTERLVQARTRMLGADSCGDVEYVFAEGGPVNVHGAERDGEFLNHLEVVRGLDDYAERREKHAQRVACFFACGARGARPSAPDWAYPLPMLASRSGPETIAAPRRSGWHSARRPCGVGRRSR
jgi:hypothetical protein